jgi:radical SAM-linked protein
MEAFAETGIEPEFFTRRPRELNEPLPWDHIDTLVAKQYLQTEWHKALNATPTSDCREGDCNACGSCDFDRIKPLIQSSGGVSQRDPAIAANAAPFVAYKKIQVHYSKTGPARFFGHLELVNIFLRALRRAGFPLKFSEGYHPKPKVAFDNPLPTGFESEDERMVVTVACDVSSSELLERLSAQLPEGLRIYECTETITRRPAVSRFRIFFDPPLPEAFRGPSIRIDLDQELSVSSHKGKLKKIALKDILKDIRMADPGCLEITLSAEPDKSMRPTELLAQLFRLSEEEIHRARFRRLKNLEI